MLRMKSNAVFKTSGTFFQYTFLSFQGAVAGMIVSNICTIILICGSYAISRQATELLPTSTEVIIKFVYFVLTHFMFVIHCRSAQCISLVVVIVSVVDVVHFKCANIFTFYLNIKSSKLS